MTSRRDIGDCFTVELRVKTTTGQEAFPALAGDKVWDGGAVEDFASRHNYGKSLDSGLRPGWCIALQPDGAWAWNLADGEKRLDYLPTAERQSVADNHWHHLAFSLDWPRREARLYCDGRAVAVYSLAELASYRGDQAPQAGTMLAGAIEGFALREGIATPAEIAAWAQRAATPAPVATDEIRVLSWNIWNGGREDGAVEGVERIIEIIGDCGADIVAMQETYGSGPRIADALGFEFYRRSSNLSLISRFPIGATHDLFDDPFRFGGATLELGPDRHLEVYTLWIHYLPDFCTDVRQPDASAAALVAAEEQTRGAEIRGILEALAPRLRDPDRPVVVAGDFNCPSHLDWTPAARALHRDLVVNWPVSQAMADAGFTDAYRNTHPDPLAHPGRTWTPRNPASWQDRIDYIYHRGLLRCAAAEVLDHHAIQWPSDHAAVLAVVQVD
jgi:endonuclease/exonuclease/phosphatase family metal-dependent hydrolase